MPLIIISHYQFSISDPYTPGPCQLSEAEAQVLNSFRASSIRDVAARWVRDAETEGSILSSSSLSDLQRRISTYDTKYSFRLRPSRSAESVLQTEIRRTAEEKVGAALRQSGIELDHSSREWTHLVQAEMETPEVQEEARRHLAAKLSSLSIDSLL